MLSENCIQVIRWFYFVLLFMKSVLAKFSNYKVSHWMLGIDYWDLLLILYY